MTNNVEFEIATCSQQLKINSLHNHICLYDSRKQSIKQNKYDAYNKSQSHDDFSTISQRPRHWK